MNEAEWIFLSMSWMGQFFKRVILNNFLNHFMSWTKRDREWANAPDRFRKIPKNGLFRTFRLRLNALKCSDKPINKKKMLSKNYQNTACYQAVPFCPTTRFPPTFPHISTKMFINIQSYLHVSSPSAPEPFFQFFFFTLSR